MLRAPRLYPIASLPRGGVVNPQTALTALGGVSDPTSEQDGNEPPPQVPLPVPPPEFDPTFIQDLLAVAPPPRSVTEANQRENPRGLETNAAVQQTLRTAIGSPAVALDALAAQTEAARKLNEADQLNAKSLSDRELAILNQDMQAKQLDIQAKQLANDTASRQANEEYVGLRGKLAVAALVAKGQAARAYTDDPLGTVDLGNIQAMTGKTGPELLAAALNDQKAKVLDQISSAFTDRIAELRATEASLARDAMAGYATYESSASELRAKQEEILSNLNGYSISTGDEKADNDTNKFIDELVRYSKQDVAPVGSPQRSIDSAKRDYIYSVLGSIIGVGESGQDNGVPRLSPEAAIALADEELKAKSFDGVPVGVNANGNIETASGQVRNQAMTELRRMLGEDLSANVDPSTWMNPNALDLWGDVMSQKIVGSAEVRAALDTAKAEKKAQDKQVIKRRDDKVQTRINDAIDRLIASGESQTPTPHGGFSYPQLTISNIVEAIPQLQKSSVVRNKLKQSSDQTLYDNPMLLQLDATLYSMFTPEDQKLIDEYIANVGVKK